MGWIQTELNDVWVFEPKIWGDERGYFFESYNAGNLPPGFENTIFVQDNEAKSKKNVLRGLHYQLPPYDQAKLVRVITGEVLDVIVDIRPDSSTYGKTFSLILNDITKKQLLVPRGFAHGYVVLSEEAIFVYKCDNFYYPAAEGGILFSDSSLRIDWIIDIKDAVVSEKDAILPLFEKHLPFIQKG